ncbi:MAG: hypothetical protein K6G06_04945 [Butyrivibrio sp.]|nr:hypothetical protein [Butyrivibrio sp.]
MDISIKPGVPDDDNRDYLPEKCKNSDIVVNENGNNSQPYPERLKEFTAVLADGVEDTWYEYVPASYDGTKDVPLVFSMHGGLMTGWGQAIYTSWTLMADRDGFIVVFPNAHQGRAWELQWGYWGVTPEETAPGDKNSHPVGLKESPDNVLENHDVKMILALMDLINSKYRIDKGRVFMQGMSMGNMMTSLFARNLGNKLAGAAGAACSTFLSLMYDENYRIKNIGGPLAIWETRPETNNIPEDIEFQKKINKYNRLYWMRLNGCNVIPRISIQGENNLAFYEGRNADVVYLDVKNRDHGQSFDDAALVWDYLFSGIRRNADGKIEKIPYTLERKGDEFALAFAENASMAWISGEVVNMEKPAFKWKKLKYHGLDGGVKVRGEYLMAPLSILAKAFGAELSYGDDTLSAEISFSPDRLAGSCKPACRKMRFSKASIGCVVDNTVRQMYCEAVHRNGELYVSAEWFAGAAFNMTVSECEGVVYITDHFSHLSLYMADLIRDILDGCAVPDNYDSMGDF